MTEVYIEMALRVNQSSVTQFNAETRGRTVRGWGANKGRGGIGSGKLMPEICSNLYTKVLRV